MPSPAYATPEDEFWYNVSQQDGLPIAGDINLTMDLKLLYAFFKKIASSNDSDSAKDAIFEALIKDPNIFGDARQFLGLSNKRAYLELSYIASRTPHPSEPYSLCGCHRFWCR